MKIKQVRVVQYQDTAGKLHDTKAAAIKASEAALAGSKVEGMMQLLETLREVKWPDNAQKSGMTTEEMSGAESAFTFLVLHQDKFNAVLNGKKPWAPRTRKSKS